jgi:hypothetical protein|tara:strand:+ start:9621 stop:10097 length:477 start_codon:yes stop_codon:yes gene_type:complete
MPESNKAIRSYYLLSEALESSLLSNNITKTVTIGDVSDVDLGKQTIFPLAHFIVNNVVSTQQTLVYNITVLVMDIKDVSKSEETDKFRKNTDEQDILNTQLGVLNLLIQKLRFGDLHTTGYRLTNDPTCEPFVDRFENNLAGWNADLEIEMPNDQYIC